jgi:hypothetical protein
MWRPGEFPCWTHGRMSWLSTKPWLWKCIWSKEGQICMWELKVVMWPRINFGYAMFHAYVKGGSYFHQVCWNIFIINFVDVMNLVKAELSYLYIDPIFNFDDLTFDNFTKLLSQFLWCFAFLLMFKCCWPSKVFRFLKLYDKFILSTFIA